MNIEKPKLILYLFLILVNFLKQLLKTSHTFFVLLVLQELREEKYFSRFFI